MRGRWASFETRLSVALCASLLLHGLGARWLLGRYIDAMTAAIAQPPIDRTQLAIATVAPVDEIGEANGIGTAIAPADGPQPLQARRADQDQPLLSLDPPGPGKIGDPPSPSMAMPGTGGDGGVASSAANAAPALPADPMADQMPRHEAPTQRAEPGKPTAAAQAPEPPHVQVAMALPPQSAVDAPAVAPTPTAAAPSAVEPAPAPPQPSQAQPTPQQTGLAPGAPGSPAPRPADPAPMADSEVDPFTHKPDAAVFLPGRTEVRAGRKVKIRRPKIGLGGQLDAVGLGGTTVLLLVRTDPTGAVSSVEIGRSSGSPNIDEACVVAMYDSWFDPPKDVNGHPRADAFPFVDKFED